ncbi:uncharacterized protein LOC105665399 [Ceratitis capitata]|uniref:Neuroparsin-A n=1 Tax=Ceratitis capitata TaxID=7213 RepID=W8CDZ2_CERCA|nr:uncharacterized protein LOC105665399 [Ceratitis capitata]
MTSRANSYLYMSFVSKLSWLLVLTLVLLQRSIQGIPLFPQTEDCGPSFSEDPKKCTHGAFVLNSNRTECSPRIICYSNLGESCQVYDYGAVSNCLPNLVCSCDKCREVLTICKAPSPFNMAKRAKPAFVEYGN